ncbi:MAG: ABC transporter ATP-binding protein [Candidatus Heimdallarchaeota archaeon]|nr:ABC transporter ATP-binding protein [Candidatus Heimdallarchaeota archaeon]
MLKIMKYAKPYRLMLLLAIGLLFAQANLELALPDYLSDIVDTGIQQGGVENAVPIAIRETELDRVLIFMNDENKSLVLDNYLLIDENSTDFNNYIEDYPGLVNESIYVFKDRSNSEINQLNQILKEPVVVVYSFERMLGDPTNASELFAMMNITMPDLQFELIPDYFFTTLSYYPIAAINQIKSSVTASFTAIGETMLDQVSVLAIRDEYEHIGVDTERIQTLYNLNAGGLMLVMTLLAVICTISVSYLAAKIAAGMARTIRRDVFIKVENFSNTEFDTFSTASLITRSTNDVTQIQNVVFMMVRMVFYAPIIGVGGIIRALNKSTSMWWLIAVAVGVLILLIILIFIIAVPKFQAIQKMTDKINLVARESLSGMLVIRAFNMQKHEEKRFDSANMDLTSLSLFINRLMVVLMPFMMLIMNGLTIGILWVGSHQVSDLALQVGDMMAFMQYAVQIVFAFLMLSMMFIILPRAVVSARRIGEVLGTEPEIKDPEEPKRFPDNFKGEIEFRDVSFRYPGAKQSAVEKVSFIAKPGQTTAFIGSTGAGKSSIVNLIPRFYDVTKGAILIDGVDIRDVTQYDLREKIGYVPQKSSLFSGTIESNMLFANEQATDEDIISAIEISQAKEFVASKEEGIQSEISQGGSNVSGGQKQRLSIARALMKKPTIYIFDDSVSALDFKTDAALRRALKQKTGDSTVLIVTQRISSIKNAEQVIVIDNGKMVGKGTHDELRKTCPIYSEIASSQLELEESS